MYLAGAHEPLYCLLKGEGNVLEDVSYSPGNLSNASLALDNTSLEYLASAAPTRTSAEGVSCCLGSYLLRPSKIHSCRTTPTPVE